MTRHRQGGVGLLVMGALGLVAACSPVRIGRTADEIRVRGYACERPPCEAGENRERLQKRWRNKSYLGDARHDYEWSYADEWKYNRVDRGRPPRTCLAMSGGGLRSAAFNIGVLSALAEIRAAGRPVLDGIDVMSAVSGGSSALSWYYTQHHHLHRAGKTRDDAHRLMFDTDGAHQRYLARHYRTFSKFEYGLGAALNVSFAPVNLFANGFFGWHANTSPMRGWYEARLRRTFQRDPLGDPQSAVDRIPLKSLAEFAVQRGLPFFVINTTVLIERDFQHLGSALGNSVFEFNALNYGSDAFGRHPYSADSPLTLSRAVSISSAAFDGAALVAGPSQAVLWSLLNIDTGIYLDNPNLSRERRQWHRVWPFPFYYWDHYQRDLEGTDLYLSDGGHAENLGAYGLVRRRCGRIIVVDAEHDPVHEFDSFRRLRDALRRELGVDVSVPGIDHLRAIEDYKPLRTRWRTAAASPVMSGKISYLPYPGEPDGQVHVVYIKMAYHPEAWKAYTPPGGAAEEARFRARHDAVERVFGRDQNASCRIDRKTLAYRSGRCPFPHRTTADQDFTPEEYRAWHDLGWLITRRHAEEVRAVLERP